MTGAILFAIAAAASGPAAAYPVQAIWNAYVSFCADARGATDGWTEVKPEPETSLAYLAMDPMDMFTGDTGPAATVYRKPVAGRTLFAFKRQTRGTGLCQVYDFEATERLNIADWTRVAGPMSVRDAPKHTQRFDFDAADKPRRPRGAIVLHQPGTFPIPDTVGFVGIQLVAVSKESL